MCVDFGAWDGFDDAFAAEVGAEGVSADAEVVIVVQAAAGHQGGTDYQVVRLEGYCWLPSTYQCILGTPVTVLWLLYQTPLFA